MATHRKETYAQARVRLHRELGDMGHLVSDPALKILWVRIVDDNRMPTGRILWFKAQAVHLCNHSMWLDIRGMSASDLLSKAGV